MYYPIIRDNIECCVKNRRQIEIVCTCMHLGIVPIQGEQDLYDYTHELYLKKGYKELKREAIADKLGLPGEQMLIRIPES